MPVLNIITRPSQISKGTPAQFTLNKESLKSHPAITDIFFQDDTKWKHISVEYKNAQGQVKTLVFDASEANPSDMFVASLKVRSNFEVQFLTIYDKDGGSFRILRSELDATSFDISFDLQAPPKPMGLVAQGGEFRQITTTWNAVAEAVSYKVYRAPFSDPQAWSLLATVTNPGHVDTGLTDNVSYYYQVSAIDANGAESDPSDPVYATTQALQQVTAPTGVTAVYSSGTMYVKWNNYTQPSGGGVLFKLQESRNGGAFQDVATRQAMNPAAIVNINNTYPKGTTVYSMGTAPIGDYQYRVVAYRDNEADSNPVSTSTVTVAAPALVYDRNLVNTTQANGETYTMQNPGMSIGEHTAQGARLKSTTGWVKYHNTLNEITQYGALKYEIDYEIVSSSNPGQGQVSFIAGQTTYAMPDDNVGTKKVVFTTLADYMDKILTVDCKGAYSVVDMYIKNIKVYRY